MEVLFENVRVPVENLLGAEGDGMKVAFSALDSGRITISATATDSLLGQRVRLQVWPTARSGLAGHSRSSRRARASLPGKLSIRASAIRLRDGIEARVREV